MNLTQGLTQWEKPEEGFALYQAEIEESPLPEVAEVSGCGLITHICVLCQSGLYGSSRIALRTMVGSVYRVRMESMVLWKDLIAG